MESIPHGSYSTYTNHACRCDLCREAAREHHRERREADPAWQAKHAERERRKDPEVRKQVLRENTRRCRERQKAEDETRYLERQAEFQKQWREKNPERSQELQKASEQRRREREPEVVRALGRERSKRWKEANPEAYRAAQKTKQQAKRLRLYELTAEEYEALLTVQHGVCAVCGKTNGLSNRNGEHQLVIDHVHGTKVVRGLLCYNCNIGLGNFKDDAALLKKAIEYLEKYP